MFTMNSQGTRLGVDPPLSNHDDRATLKPNDEVILQSQICSVDTQEKRGWDSAT